MGSQGKKKKINKKSTALKIFFIGLFFILFILPVLIAPTVEKHMQKSPADFVEFINVGQGDCTLIKSGNEVAIIDFGVEASGKRIYKRLLEYGIESIDTAIITHHHSDHMGGFLKLAKKIEIKRLIIGNTTAEDGERDIYNSIISLARSMNIKIVLPQIGNIFKIGNASIEILAYDSAAPEENNRSVIFKLCILNNSLLFTGDAENTAELNLAKSEAIKCDILKLGHHGSDTSSCTEFLKAVSPEITIASCGYDNDYNHPAADVVQRLKEYNIKYLRTDLNRSIRLTFNSNKNTYAVTTERGFFK